MHRINFRSIQLYYFSFTVEPKGQARASIHDRTTQSNCSASTARQHALFNDVVTCRHPLLLRSSIDERITGVVRHRTMYYGGWVDLHCALDISILQYGHVQRARLQLRGAWTVDRIPGWSGGLGSSMDPVTQ